MCTTDVSQILEALDSIGWGLVTICFIQVVSLVCQLFTGK